MKPWLILHCLLCMVLIATASEHSNLNQNYTLKGICNIDGTWMLSIKDNPNRQHFWLKVGQRFGDLHLHTFDPDSSTATLLYQEEEFTIALAESDNLPIMVISSRSLTFEQIEQIKKKVESHRQGLNQVLLATPKSGPRSLEARKKIEQDLENAVANYRQRLMSQAEDNSITNEVSTAAKINAATVGTSSNEVSIIGVKRRNRVNSRIWSSDHIKKHGMPED
jgi:hypothetical protein